MNEIQKFTPSNAVVSVPLNELDNLRFELLKLKKENEELINNMASVRVIRTMYDSDSYGRRISSERFDGFKKFEDFESSITKKVEDKFKTTINNLESHLENTRKDYDKRYKEVTEIKEKNTLLSEKIGTFTEENQILTKKLENKETQIEDLKNIISKQTSEIVELRNVLKEESIKYKLKKYFSL